jgi:nitrogen fixation NifU-like protein
MMSAAIKGKTIPQARALVRAFKGMMSVHSQRLDGSSDDLSDDLVPSDPASIAEDVSLGDLEALQGVVKFPVRIKCATLSWNTLVQALDEATARTG